MQWQPIETAPRDGTEILTCRAGSNFAATIRVCWYVKDQYEGEYWQDDADSEPDPTHWAALPSPPDAKCLDCGGTDDDHIANYYCPTFRAQ